VGPKSVNDAQPAFYARPGSVRGDLIALLHPPYTAWHLAYVAMGAALAPTLDWTRLAGTLAAFFLGTGVGAHALDEWHDRPLGTNLSNRVLLALGLGGLAGAAVLAVVGSFVISAWVLAWAVIGCLLAAGYSLELHHTLHSDLGFALAWGAFPAIVGYWAQAETINPGILLVASAVMLISLAQRSLSKHARFVRRSVASVSIEFEVGGQSEPWSQNQLLTSWELPLQLLTASIVMLGLALVVLRA
jgi:hypothetical protein